MTTIVQSDGSEMRPGKNKNKYTKYTRQNNNKLLDVERSEDKIYLLKCYKQFYHQK